MFLWYGWPTKGVYPYFQLGPVLEIPIISNLWHAASRIWTFAEPEVRFYWMKLCNRNTHYTTAAKFTQKIQNSHKRCLVLEYRSSEINLFSKNLFTKKSWKIYKFQPFRCVLRKGCSENMQQTYMRTPMPKCEIALQHARSHVSLLHIFRIPFHMNTSGRLLL